MHLICPTAPAKYFSLRGWTENIDLPVGQMKALRPVAFILRDAMQRMAPARMNQKIRHKRPGI
jgi:hypothetical protein